MVFVLFNNFLLRNNHRFIIRYSVVFIMHVLDVRLYLRFVLFNHLGVRLFKYWNLDLGASWADLVAIRTVASDPL